MGSTPGVHERADGPRQTCSTCLSRVGCAEATPDFASSVRKSAEGLIASSMSALCSRQQTAAASAAAGFPPLAEPGVFPPEFLMRRGCLPWLLGLTILGACAAEPVGYYEGLGSLGYGGPAYLDYDGYYGGGYGYAPHWYPRRYGPPSSDPDRRRSHHLLRRPASDAAPHRVRHQGHRRPASDPDRRRSHHLHRPPASDLARHQGHHRVRHRHHVLRDMCGTRQSGGNGQPSGAALRTGVLISLPRRMGPCTAALTAPDRQRERRRR
jgi:hypothetical protein